MLQNLAVALIVVCAALYVARKYLPASLRTWLVYRLRRCGTTDSRLAAWLDVGASCGSGEGACSSCQACAPDADAPVALPPKQQVIRIVRR